MSKIHIHNLRSLENAPTSPARLRTKIGEVILHSAVASAKVEVLNPETGEVWEYSLPENAKPHTVTPDAEGNIWYTGNSNGTIGKLDPRTGRITEYKMPDPAARDPHTAVFDKKGTLWFTLQISNMVGRLIPATGDIKLVKVARPNSRPYGIKVASDGSLWVACNGGNACKGQSECKTANSSCKGQNACKGQGFVSLTPAECKIATQRS